MKKAWLWFRIRAYRASIRARLWLFRRFLGKRQVVTRAHALAGLPPDRVHALSLDAQRVADRLFRLAMWYNWRDMQAHMRPPAMCPHINATWPVARFPGLDMLIRTGYRPGLETLIRTGYADTRRGTPCGPIEAEL